MLHPRILTPYFALVLVLIVAIIWALSYVRRHHCSSNNGRLPFRRPGTPHSYNQSVWKEIAQVRQSLHSLRSNRLLGYGFAHSYLLFVILFMITTNDENSNGGLYYKQ
jgi:hypothetical protein